MTVERHRHHPRDHDPFRRATARSASHTSTSREEEVLPVLGHSGAVHAGGVGVGRDPDIRRPRGDEAIDRSNRCAGDGEQHLSLTSDRVRDLGDDGDAAGFGDESCTHVPQARPARPRAAFGGPVGGTGRVLDGRAVRDRWPGSPLPPIAAGQRHTPEDKGESDHLIRSCPRSCDACPPTANEPGGFATPRPRSRLA